MLTIANNVDSNNSPFRKATAKGRLESGRVHFIHGLIGPIDCLKIRVRSRLRIERVERGTFEIAPLQSQLGLERQVQHV